LSVHTPLLPQNRIATKLRGVVFRSKVGFLDRTHVYFVGFQQMKQVCLPTIPFRRAESTDVELQDIQVTYPRGRPAPTSATTLTIVYPTVPPLPWAPPCTPPQQVPEHLQTITITAPSLCRLSISISIFLSLRHIIFIFIWL
jgi:hypothetical protein